MDTRIRLSSHRGLNGHTKTPQTVTLDE